MSGDITTIIVSTLAAAIAAPLGAWVSSIILRRKYQIELDSLRADNENKLAEAKGKEVDNVRKALEVIMANVVAPLEKEIKSLRKDVGKFRRAVEKIPSCPMAGSCPVSHELRSAETDDERDKPDS